MKKVIRNLAAITLAGAMMLGTGVTAYAATTSTNENSNYTTDVSGEGALTSASDTDTIKLIKDYDSVNPTGTTAPKSESPAEAFTYEITPYGVWNAGSDPADSTTLITKETMPMFGGTANTSYTVTVDADSKGVAFYESPDSDANQNNDKNFEISVPTYNTVGDYWYKVEETLGNTTGVMYGTNSNKNSGSTDADVNGGYTRVYYIHVQVTEAGTTAGTPALVRSVTMHKSAPETSLTNAQYNETTNTNVFYNASNKVNAIENKYYAGDLVIKKTVTGNAGDKNKFFKVKVTFTKPKGTVINSDIVCNDAYLLGTNGKYTNTSPITIYGQHTEGTESETNRYWTGEAENTDAKTVFCEFYVKDDTTVTFSNIPYGINYTITEEEPTDNNYTNNITFTSSSAETGTVKFDNVILNSDTNAKDSLSDDFTKSAKGSISDAHDEVTIENNKVSAIDIGVLLSNAPFIALLGVAGAGAAVLVRRKRRIGE